MVETSLVASLPINEGRNVLHELDSAGMRISSAFWRQREEGQGWQLYLATPLADEWGLFKSYMKIRAILDEMPSQEKGDLRLDDFALVSPDSNFMGMMRRRFGSVPAETIRPAWRAGASDDEPFIYRLQ